MCTLTLLREPRRAETSVAQPQWRIVFNRDEQRSRPEANPPAEHLCGSVRTLHPVDPLGGGTWIAATEHGVVFALLNGADLEPAPDDSRPRRSRGAIIPRLAAAGVRRAVDAPVRDIDPADHRAFHLVIADDREIVDVTSDGRSLTRAHARADDWLMRTSSSFASEAVRAWRERLFASVETPASAESQDAFHMESEPGRPAFGVAMARPDACTVSTTTVDVFATAIRMTYRAVIAPDRIHVAELTRTLR